MMESEIYAALTEILRDALVNETLVVTPELTAKQVPGWDSFKHIEIIIATEERFGVKFVAQELVGVKCVGDLAKLVQSKKT